MRTPGQFRLPFARIDQLINRLVEIGGVERGSRRRQGREVRYCLVCGPKHRLTERELRVARCSRCHSAFTNPG